ncbi:hypothetical protein BgiMline_033020 [Biomphalaria glabrata]
MEAFINNGTISDFLKFDLRILFQFLQMRQTLIEDTYLALWSRIFEKVFIVGMVAKCFGLLSSIFSFLIFYHSDLRSPSNILILTLTVGECMYTLRGNDMVILVKMITKDNWLLNSGAILDMAIMVVTVLENVGMYAAATIIVLITVDRCIAVLLPLRYSSIVTTRRAWICSLSALLMWAPWQLFLRITTAYCLIEKFKQAGFCSTDFMMELQTTAIIVSESFMACLPVLIVLIGCTIIGTRITLSQRRRVKLIANSVDRKSNLRTTKLLLSISLAFAIVYGYSFVIMMLGFDELSIDYWMYTALDSSRYIFIDINSACNFLVYVLGNAKFKRTFLNMFTPLRRRRLMWTFQH